MALSENRISQKKSHGSHHFPNISLVAMGCPPSPSIQWVPGHRTSRRGTVGWNPRVHSARHPQRSTGRVQVIWWIFGTFETFDCYGSCGYGSTWCTVLNHIEPVPLILQGCKTPPFSVVSDQPMVCPRSVFQIPCFIKIHQLIGKSNISGWPIVLLSKYDSWHWNSYFVLIKSC